MDCIAACRGSWVWLGCGKGAPTVRVACSGLDYVHVGMSDLQGATGP